MSSYRDQVSLLLMVLPEVAKQKCFALHGGTAINLFIRDMPRLSVDIDLTYIPIEGREKSLSNIIVALKAIQTSIHKIFPNFQVALKEKILKLQISNSKALIKLEVNQVNRGLLDEVFELPLGKNTQKEFNAFCAIQVVSLAQLYGGKICAALDRQHPRDLFDVKYLLDREGLTENIKKGFLLLLLCSNRPMNEMLNPNLLDQQEVMVHHFAGMTFEIFTYKDFEKTRQTMIELIHQSLTDYDKQFLLAFNNLKPDWSVYDFKKFPAIQWKLKNLTKLKEKNKEKFNELNSSLSKLLN
ncbi:MAG: nucleotidyl transferase AbiEii/AbiGii toxin family protein [Polaribacter sp.]